MPKKKKKKAARQKITNNRALLVKFIVVLLVLLAVALLGKFLSPTENYKVLGTKTYLAENSEVDVVKTEENAADSIKEQESTENTIILCIGPDNKQFETTKKECKELNKAWKKQAKFKELPPQEKQRPQKTETLAKPSVKPSRSETDKSKEEEFDMRAKTEVKPDKERIDNRFAKDKIKIATAGANKFLVQVGTTGAVTDFPVSVDPATDTLYVTTPNGKKALTVLPEKAIQNMIDAQVVNRVDGKALTDETLKNNPESVSQLVKLSDIGGIPVYEINGISDQKLLGLFPVQIEKKVTVSADTGNAVIIKESFGARILDALSF